MMRRDTLPMSCKRHALHAPRRTRAAINTAYPVSSFALSPMRTQHLLRNLVVTVRRQIEWDHLNRRVTHFVEKTIDNRPMQQNVPTRTRCLSEDHVRDPFSTRKIDQRIRDATGLEFDHTGSQVTCELDVFLKRRVIRRLDPAQLLARRFDIHGVPV